MAYTLLQRLYVPEPLAGGAAVTLGKDQSHYLLNVMRMGVGDAVLLFNGTDGEWRAEILGAGKKSSVLSLTEQTREQSVEPDVWLLFAPLKKDRTDFVIEKATELGVSRILPVQTDRTQTSRVNVDRLQSTATEASEQSRRLTVPVVEELKPLSKALDSWPEDRVLVHLDENGTGSPLARVLSPLPDMIAFLIGPEGGFSDTEIADLGRRRFTRAADLGPRILRAETAAVSALAIRQGIDDAAKDVNSSPTEI